MAGTWPSELLDLANRTYVATWKNRPQNVYNLAAIAIALLIVFISIRLGMAYLKSEVARERFAASASAALTVPGGARHEDKSSVEAETSSERSSARPVRAKKAQPKKKAVAKIVEEAAKPAAKKAPAPKKVAKKATEQKAAATPVKKVAARSTTPAPVSPAKRSTPARRAASPARTPRAASRGRAVSRGPSATRVVSAARSTRSRK